MILFEFVDLHKKGGEILFFDNFDRYCKRDGKTNSEVAKAIGLDPSSCTGWRKGAIPRNGTVKKLADYFGVTVDDLLADNKKEPAGDGGLDEDMKEFVELAKKMTPEERSAILTLMKSKEKNSGNG